MGFNGDLPTVFILFALALIHNKHLGKTGMSSFKLFPMIYDVCSSSKHLNLLDLTFFNYFLQ